MYTDTTVSGHVVNAGVHGRGVDLPLDKLWISNIAITRSLVNTNTTGTLLKLVAQHKLPVDPS
jgi:alcohol dehydrogenase